MELDNTNLKKESANEKRARLDKRNQRAQELRRAETEQERQARLKKRNEKGRAKRKAESLLENSCASLLLLCSNLTSLCSWDSQSNFFVLLGFI